MNIKSIKTHELYGEGLGFAVARVKGYNVSEDEEGIIWIEWKNSYSYILKDFLHDWNPAYNWCDGGPIIEQERISTQFETEYSDTLVWSARKGNFYAVGSNPLEAGMRVYCLINLGSEVDIPEELL